MRSFKEVRGILTEIRAGARVATPDRECDIAVDDCAYGGLEMSIEVIMGDPEDIPDPQSTEGTQIDADEFFAKNAFRIVYQTNNFFLPQIRDLIDKGEVINRCRRGVGRN